MSTIRIEALPTPIRIIHIPLSVHHDPTNKTTSYHLNTTLRFADSLSPEFFGLNSNTVEIALFGSEALIEEVWGDYLGAGALSSVEFGWGCEGFMDGGKKGDQVEVSGVWRVFQVAEEEGFAGDDDPDSVIRKIARPLAASNVSIKYQSSAYADFIMVKEADYGEAMTTFERQGWRVAISPPLSTTPSSTRLRQTPPFMRPSLSHSGAINIVPPLTASTISMPRSITWLSASPSRTKASSSAPQPTGNFPLHCPVPRPMTSLRPLSAFGESALGPHHLALDLKLESPFEIPLTPIMWSNGDARADTLDVQLVSADALGEQEDLQDLFDGPSPLRAEIEPDSLASSGVLPRVSLEMLKQESNIYRRRSSGADLDFKPPPRPLRPILQVDLSRFRDGTFMHGSGKTIAAQPEVRVLDSRIAMVGLNNETQRKWEYRMTGFLGWPEKHSRTVRTRGQDGTIAEATFRASGNVDDDRPSYISFIRTVDGTSLATELSHLRTMFPDAEDRGELLQSGHELESWDEEEPWLRLLDVENVSAGSEGSFNFDSFVRSNTPSPLTCSSMELGDSPVSTSSELMFGTPPRRRRIERTGSAVGPGGPANHDQEVSRMLEEGAAHSSHGDLARSHLDRNCESAYTATKDYPSRSTLAFMQECITDRQRPKTWPAMSNAKDIGDEAESAADEGVKRCLQIDLRGDDRVGFDKSGLILRLSDSLHKGGMKMLYSSTMYTANVLVESHESKKAEKMLASVTF